jgi:hypothetical protein
VVVVENEPELTKRGDIADAPALDFNCPIQLDRPVQLLLQTHHHVLDLGVVLDRVT